MKQKSGPEQALAEQVLKDIRRQTRRQYSRLKRRSASCWVKRLRGEENILELCCREGIAVLDNERLWPGEFLEAGKRRLAGGHGPRRNVRRGEGPPS